MAVDFFKKNRNQCPLTKKRVNTMNVFTLFYLSKFNQLILTLTTTYHYRLPIGRVVE